MQAGKARRYVEIVTGSAHVSTVLSRPGCGSTEFEQKSLNFRLSWSTPRGLISEVATRPDASSKVSQRDRGLHRELEEVRQIETEKRVARRIAPAGFRCASNRIKVVVVMKIATDSWRSCPMWRTIVSVVPTPVNESGNPHELCNCGR